MKNNRHMGMGDVIKAHREARGWKIVELAARADVAVATISRLENGKQGFKSVTLRKIAAALEITLETLFQPEVKKETKVLLMFLDRIEKLLRCIRSDTREELIPVLDGIINWYSEKLPQTPEIMEIRNEVKREDWRIIRKVDQRESKHASGNRSQLSQKSQAVEAHEFSHTGKAGETT